MNQQRFTPEAYTKSPIAFEQGIPVFSGVDRYVANYQKIASDHIQAMRPGHANPFMDTQLWEILERSTTELLVRHVPTGSKVLDVGVGLGRVLGPLSQYERYGIDISFDYLAQTRARGIEVAFSKIEDMPYVDEYFDAVMVCDVLEHVIDLNSCCANILRVLKPGGTLLVRVPYREDLSGYLADDLPYEYVHLRNFDEYSLRLFFEKIMNCSVIEMAQVAPVLQGPPRMKLRQLPLASPIYKALNEIDFSGVAASSAAERRSAEVAGARRSFSFRITNRVLMLLGLPSFDERVELAALRTEQGKSAKASLTTAAHPLALLKKATQVSEEEFTNWVYALRDSHSSLYEKIVDEITYGSEINVVVRKGSSSAVSVSH